MLLKLLIHLTLFECIIFATVSIQDLIYENAKANIGDKSWAKEVDRQAKRNENVFVLKDEWKCNLFVYEIILASGYDIGTPNSVNCKKEKYKKICEQKKDKRPPCCKDWFDEKVPGFDLIGKNDEGRKLCQKGDIITNGGHIAIVSNPEDGSTISAAENEVIFGENFKIFRYNENTLNKFSSTKSIKESSGKFYTISIFLLFLIVII